MVLELHDTEEGDTLFARVKDIDYMYQAEEWVNLTFADESHKTVVRWVLKSGDEVVRVWERPAGSVERPTVV